MLNSENKVLIQCGDLIENQQRILPLAESLRALGHKPIILHYRDSSSFFSSRGFKTTGLNFYREKVKKNHINRDTLPSSFFEFEPDPVASIKYALKKSTKLEFERDTYMLRRDAVALTRLIEKEQIDRIITWNGVTGAVANSLRMIAHDQVKNGGFLERGYVSGSVFFDHFGTNGCSSLSRGITAIYPDDKIDASLASLETVLEKKINIVAGKEYTRSKIILVPLQVQMDSNILLYSSKFKTMRSLVLDACDLARKLGAGWKVVVRDHPEEQQVNLNIPYNDILCRDNESNLEELLANCSVVYTVNSTVGLTAASKGKVVVCNGTGIYCNENFVINAEKLNVEETCSRVAAALETPPTKNDIKKFFAILLHRHHILPGVEEGIPLFGKTLEFYGERVNSSENQQNHSLRILRRKLAEIAQSEDLEIGVHLFLTFQEKIPLTYRITDQVSINWIKTVLAKNFPDTRFSKIGGTDTIKSKSICILPSSSTPDETHNQYIAVIDEFGYPHEKFYAVKSEIV